MSPAHKFRWFLVCLAGMTLHLAADAGALAQALNSPADGRITGRVLEAGTQTPLALVDVFIEKLSRGDVSDSTGRFSIPSLPPGRYDVIFKRQGYKTVVKRGILLTSGSSLVLETSLRSSVLEADDIVVTATRNNEYEHDVPQLVTVVTAGEIRDKNISQTPELLKEEPGIFVQKTNQGGGSPVIRGLKANKLLLLLDGVRMNNATYRGGNLQYLNTLTASTLEKIEVVHGPVSALYGSDALGGAINAITQTPEPGLSHNWQLKLRGAGRLTTADEIRSGQLSATLTHQKIAFLFAGSLQRYGDVRRGANGGSALMQRLRNDSRTTRVLNRTQAPNGYDARDATAKVVYTPDEGHQLQLLLQTSRQPSVPRYDVYERGAYGTWLYSPQERDFGYISYQLRRRTALFHSANFTISRQRQAETRLRQRPGAAIQTSDMFATTTTGLQLQLNRLLGDDHFVVYGVEFYSDDVASASSESDLSIGTQTPLLPLYPDGSSYRSFGAFAQGEFSLNRRWIVDVGLRYSWFRLRAPFADQGESLRALGTLDQRPNAVTGSLGTRYRLTDAVNLVANLAQGFRAPNLDDVSKLGPGKGGSFYDVPNPDAGPEKLLNMDLGIKIASGPLRANVVGWYGRLNDLLVRQQGSFLGLPYVVDGPDTLAAFRKENVGRAYTAGLEASAKMQLGNGYTASANIGYTYGQNVSQNTPLPAIPPLFGFAAVRYAPGRSWVELYSRFAAAQTRLAPEDFEDLRIPEGGTPGWATLNLRAGTELNEYLSLRAALTNLFDLNYREYLSGLNAPGRNVVLELGFSL